MQLLKNMSTWTLDEHAACAHTLAKVYEQYSINIHIFNHKKAIYRRKKRRVNVPKDQVFYTNQFLYKPQKFLRTIKFRQCFDYVLDLILYVLRKLMQDVTLRHKRELFQTSEDGLWRNAYDMLHYKLKPRFFPNSRRQENHSKFECKDVANDPNVCRRSAKRNICDK